MECKRSVYQWGAGLEDPLGSKIDDPTLLFWSRYFLEEEDGKSISNSIFR